MSINIENLWFKKLLVSTENAHADEKRAISRRKRSEREVLKVLEKQAPQILLGEKESHVSEKLVDELILSLADSSQGFEKNRAKHNIFIRILALGKIELDWNVIVPPPITKVVNQASTISSNTFEYNRQFKDVLAHYRFAQKTDLLSNLQSSLSEKPEQSKKFEFGLVLFNLIVFDGVLDKLALGLLAKIQHPIWCEGKYSWLTFFDQKVEVMKSLPPRRRYFISAASAALLFRFYQRYTSEVESNRLSEKFTTESLNFFLTQIGLKNIKFGGLLSLTKSVFQLHLPPYLLPVLTGNMNHKNLSDERLVQMMRGAKTKKKGINETTLEKSHIAKLLPISIKKTNDTDSNIYFSERELSKFKKALYSSNQDKRKTNKEVSDIFQTWIDMDGFAPILRYFAAWLQSIKTRQRTKYQYLTELGTNLLIFFGAESVNENSFEALNASYEEILENSINIKSRNRKAVLISRFHSFLIQCADLPDIKLSSSEREAQYDQEESGAHADFVTEDEFSLIKTMFSNDSSNFKNENLFILVLMYRCGLRISEAASIRIKDVHCIRIDGTLRISLFIRNSDYVENKSSDSRRSLPLHFLMLKDELEAFCLFFEHKKCERDLNKMLFSEDADGQRPISSVYYYNILRRAFRDICGSSTLTAHSLRHSLANHLLLKLHLSTSTFSSPIHLEKLKEMLFADVSKSYLYLVSSMLGHASPATTLSNYVHIQDILIHQFISKINFYDGEVSEVNHYEENFKCLLPLLNIKPELYRQWRSRYGDLVSSINRGYLRNNKAKFDESYFEPLPEISLELYQKTKTVADLSFADLVSLIESRDHYKKSSIPEELYDLKEGEFLKIQSSINEIMLAKVLQKTSTTREAPYRHFAIKSLGEERLKTFKSLSGNELILMSPPVLPYDRDDASKIFNDVIEGIRDDILNKTENTINQLRFFHVNHRAREGYILLKDAEQGSSFIDWLVSLNQSKKVYEVSHLPSSISKIPINKQVIFWRKSISSKSKKLLFLSLSPSAKYKKDYGTAKLKFLKSDTEDKSFRGAQGLKYALVLSCMVCHSMGVEFE